MQPLGIYPRREADPIDLVYEAAEAVQRAYQAVQKIPFAQRPALDVLLDGPVFPGDLDVLANKLNALADEWGDEIASADDGSAS